MNKTFSKKEIGSFFYIAFFIAIVSFAPIFKNQIIIGTIVNAALFLSVHFLGFKRSYFMAFLPSLMSISFGFLSNTIFYLIPFIMFSNLVLMFTFNFFKRRFFYVAFLIAASFKCLFLYFINVFFGLLSNLIFSKMLFQVLNIGQIFTSFLGAMIAFSIISIHKKNLNFKN